MRVVGCFLQYEDRFVLVHRLPHKVDGDTWGLPSGKVESGEIDPENLYILSACVSTPYCMREKRDWLYKYLPFIPKRNIILIKVGENKADMVEFFLDTELTKEDILIDDYTKNLTEWEFAGGTGIKALNGINGKNGVWKGLAVVAN